MSLSATVEPLFFASPEEFYGWLEEHQCSERGLDVPQFRRRP